MSLKQHTAAKLDMFGYPIFPRGMADFVKACTQAQIHTGRAMQTALTRVQDFKRIDYTDIVTDDGYVWSMIIMFSSLEGNWYVAVLMPYEFDMKCLDGTLYDRSPAVYTKGANAEIVDDLFEKIVGSINATVLVRER